MQWFLFRGSLGWLSVWFVVGQLAANVVGHRLAAWGARKAGEPDSGPVNTIVGAVLGILALLLGFSFAMVISRDDARRQVVVSDANAIGTLVLRAELLPAPHAARMRSLLVGYVDQRVALASPENVDALRFAAALAECDRTHGELWAEALAATREGVDPRLAALVVEAVNAVIDVHGERVAAILGHVPAPVLLLLVAVAVLSHGLIGYACGLAGRRYAGAGLVAVLLTSAVMLLIVDLDRPRHGFVVVSQEPMLALQRQLAAQ